MNFQAMSKSTTGKGIFDIKLYKKLQDTHNETPQKKALRLLEDIFGRVELHNLPSVI